MPDFPANVDVARKYLRAIEQGATGEALAQFFATSVMQEEFPNRLSPQGARRDLQAILAAAEQGQKVLSHQSYEIKNVIASQGSVALEVVWTGTLKIPVATLSAGTSMRARFAVFLEFSGGKIVAQRNYDCFDSW